MATAPQQSFNPANEVDDEPANLPGVDNVQDNAGTRQAGTDDEPQDVRSLLNRAMKDTTDTGQDDGRTRGPDGKFVAKPAVDPNAQPVPDQNTQQQQGQTDLVAQTEAIISKLPDNMRTEVQQIIQARDAAFNNWVAPLVSQLNGFEAIEKVIGPRREAWARNGMSPEQAVNQLFALSDFASRDPAGFIQQFAATNNIDLTTLEDDGEQVDPEVLELRQKVAQLEQGFQSNQQQQQQQTQQQQHQERAQQVAQFATEKDAQGQLLRPHFEAVVDNIMQALPGLRAANPNAHPSQLLQSAYDTAIWANPTTRASLIEAERLKSASDRARNARQAGSSVTGAPGSDAQQAKPPANSVREALNLAILEHQ